MWIIICFILFLIFIPTIGDDFVFTLERYHHLLKNANTKISPLALIPALPAVYIIYRLVLQLFVTMTMLEDKNKILKKYETVLEGNEALVILSIIITVVIMQFVLLWYIKRMDYVFYDGLVYEKPANMLKFNLEVFVMVLIFALIMWVIFCLVPMADTYYGFMFQSIFNWIIIVPVTIYLLHRLFTVWLDRSFNMIK